MEYPVEYPSLNRIIGQRCLKKNPAIVAFSLVSSWERGVGKTTSNQCYDSIPWKKYAWWLCIRVYHSAAMCHDPLSCSSSSHLEIISGLVQNSFPPTIWSVNTWVHDSCCPTSTLCALPCILQHKALFTIYF